MVDVFTQEKRSWMMARIGGKNTKPEMVVRRILHSLGYRFRLHKKALPGTPDIVLKKHKTIIFVNGCFWHRHQGCKRATVPKSNVEYWEKKLSTNVERFEMQKKKLEALGWNVLVVWECETKDKIKLCRGLSAYLKGRNNDL